MIAAGIDLGGSKLEAQIFNAEWTCVDRLRVKTPTTYDSLLQTLQEAIDWIEGQDGNIPIGIGSAGLIVPQTGIALTANLPATGKSFPKDVAERAGRSITYVNDCRAFALSEAIFGSGRKYDVVMGMILGTGVGGGGVINGHLLKNRAGLAGEFGHIQAPASLVQAHNLPILPCGCGRLGCIETLVSGPGLTRISEAVLGSPLSPQEVDLKRHNDEAVAGIFDIWCNLVAELCLSIDYILNPDVIILGGGLSKIKDVDHAISQALRNRQFDGFDGPEIKLAQGGDASGVRGAAYAAWQESQRHA